MSHENETSVPPEIKASDSGSFGSQTATSSALVPATNYSAPKDVGLIVVGAEEVAALVRSEESPDVKQQMLVAMMLGQLRSEAAELKFKLHAAEKENTRLRRQLTDKQQECGQLAGDVRVLNRDVVHANSHRNQRAVLGSLSNILVGIGGVFFFRNWWTVGICLSVAAILYYITWFYNPAAPAEQ